MASVDELASTTFSGRRFTRRQLAQVQETVGMFPKLSRRELAQTICEHLDWKNARGANKTECCLRMLETLEAGGLLDLPEKRPGDVAPKHAIRLELAEQGEAIEANLQDVAPISLERVVTPEQRAQFKASIQAYHYLGYRHLVGSQLGYFIVSQKRARRLGCLLYSSSASWNLPPRDEWIGWDKRVREKNRHLILTQSRFLLFPWVNVPHLASHVLGLAEKQVAADWLETYGYRPLLLETFVDPARGFSGTCYRAANWLCVGRTKPRGGHDARVVSGHAEEGGCQRTKEIFVRPLIKDAQHALRQGYQARQCKRRYRNDLKSSRTQRVDDAFLTLWKQIVHLLQEVAATYDKHWRVRERVIDTRLLMLLIFRLVTAKNRQGYGTTIDELWDHSRELNLPLPQKESISPSSLCEARRKLDENVFKSLHQKVLQAYAEHSALSFTWLGHRVFAVDGSRVNLPRPLRHAGYPLAEGTYYPQGLVSCLYELKSKLPVDFDLVAHGDERRCAQQHLRALKPGDVVVYDRGYFSYVLLHHHVEAGIHAVFRLQGNSASAINDFAQSVQTDALVTLYPSARTLADITREYPDIHIVPRTMRLVKYQAGGTTICLGTTLVGPAEASIPSEALAELYHGRWGVEELYKVSKRIMMLEAFHSQHERGVKQEVFANFVLVGISRLFANQADTDANGDRTHNQADPPHSTACSRAAAPAARPIQTNFKNCIHVVARQLEQLLLLHAKLFHAVQTTYDLIIKRLHRVRPGRSYPRKSMRPESKWRPSKKRTTPRPPLLAAGAAVVPAQP